MIKYFVRTTGDRVFEYDLKYEALIDREKKPVDSFIRQLKHISQWDSVLLEDDLVLCKDFKNKIEEVIKQYPDKIINFFTRPNDWFTTHESSIFAYNQCTYYPKGVAMTLANKMDELYKKYPRSQYDIIENLALKELGIAHIQHRPCLVQHMDNNSLVGNHADGYRRCPYFIDYLEELGIKFEDSFKVENRIKLQNRLKEEGEKYYGHNSSKYNKRS